MPHSIHILIVSPEGFTVVSRGDVVSAHFFVPLPLEVDESLALSSRSAVII